MPRDYALDLLDSGQLTQAAYDKLLAARSRDFAATNARLAEVSKKGNERRLRSLNGQGDGGKQWQCELDAWALKA